MNSLMIFQGVFGENQGTGNLLADAEALSIPHPKARPKRRFTLWPLPRTITSWGFTQKMGI